MHLQPDELRTLGMRVLHQAMRDAVIPIEVDADVEGTRWEAVAFCTELTGSYADWRTIWCDVVGIPESTYRREAARRIASGEVPPMPPPMRVATAAGVERAA